MTNESQVTKKQTWAEKTFDNLMDYLKFQLVKDPNEYFYLKDKRKHNPTKEFESQRFGDAFAIFEALEKYIKDLVDESDFEYIELIYEYRGSINLDNCSYIEIPKNKWEQLFDSFMDLIEFSLINYENGEFGVEDRQGANLGDIESDKFKTTEEIFERLDIYINDYIDEDLENVWVEELGKDLDDAPEVLSEWLNYKEELKDYSYELNLIDMICNHYQDICLENCNYKFCFEYEKHKKY